MRRGSPLFCMINTIKTAIIGLLNGLEGIKNVFGYQNQDAQGGYPYICVIWESNEAEVITNSQDRVRATFKISLFQEKFEQLKGREAAETTSDDRTHKIEKVFRDNNDLGLSDVLRVLPVNSKKTYIDGGTRIQVEVSLSVEFLQDVKI